MEHLLNLIKNQHEIRANTEKDYEFMIENCKLGIDLLIESGVIVWRTEDPKTGDISENNSSKYFAVRYLLALPQMYLWCLEAVLSGNYTIASQLFRPILESQINYTYYLEFPEYAHQLMLSSLKDRDSNEEGKSKNKKHTYNEPKPRSKMKQLGVNQTHILYRYWEFFNEFTSHPISILPSIFAEGSGSGTIDVEPFYSENSAIRLLEYLENSLRLTLGSLLPKFDYLTTENRNWYERLKSGLDIEYEN